MARLVSAAKQTGTPYDARRVWLTVMNSARYIPNIALGKQGNGIVDVNAAFEPLKTYAKAPPTIQIVASDEDSAGASGDVIWTAGGDHGHGESVAEIKPARSCATVPVDIMVAHARAIVATRRAAE